MTHPTLRGMGHWQGWPFPDSTEVWVLPSTSGAAPMTTAERFGTWQALAARLQEVPWPRRAACAPAEAGKA